MAKTLPFQLLTKSQRDVVQFFFFFIQFIVDRLEHWRCHYTTPRPGVLMVLFLIMLSALLKAHLSPLFSWFNQSLWADDENPSKAAKHVSESLTDQEQSIDWSREQELLCVSDSDPVRLKWGLWNGTGRGVKRGEGVECVLTLISPRRGYQWPRKWVGQWHCRE